MNRIAFTIRRKPRIPKGGCITGSVTWTAICVRVIFSPRSQRLRLRMPNPISWGLSGTEKVVFGRTGLYVSRQRNSAGQTERRYILSP